MMEIRLLVIFVVTPNIFILPRNIEYSFHFFIMISFSPDPTINSKFYSFMNSKDCESKILVIYLIFFTFHLLFFQFIINFALTLMFMLFSYNTFPMTFFIFSSFQATLFWNQKQRKSFLCSIHMSPLILGNEYKHSLENLYPRFSSQ